MATFSEFIAAGVDLCYLGVVGTDGYLSGQSPTAPAAGNQNGSLMKRSRGMVNADPTIPQPEVVGVPGDNGSQGTFIYPSDQTPSFTVEKSVFDLAVDAMVQRTKVLTDGNVKMGLLQPSPLVQENICWVLQSPVKKKDAGVSGVGAWHGYIIPASSGVPLGRAAFATRAAATDRIQVTANPVDKNIDGMEINDAIFGADEAPIIPFTSDYPIVFQRWTGDGVEDTFVMGVTAAAAAEITIRVDGVIQVLTTDY
ncbi:MAG TPA: hypothetical protein VH681_00070, partial [Nitrospiraceae bacterium]